MDTKTHQDTDSTTASSPVVPYNVDSGSNSSDSHSTVREDSEPKNSDHVSTTGVDQEQEPSQDESVTKPEVSNPTTTTTSQSSSSVSPDTVSPTEPQPPSSEPTTELTNASAEVRELAIMFPQIPVAILEAVLAAHQNDPGECVSDLLAMNDPTWKPAPEDIMKSDEALARQLAREEEQRMPAQPIPQINVPYQPRIKRNPSNRTSTSTYEQRTETPSTFEPGQSSASNITGKDEIQKIAEEFSKMAETGKKTVSTWLTKAKAKIQELQQPPTDLPIDPTTHEKEYPQPQPAIVINGAEYGGGSSSNPKRSTRISPALPYASRYDSTPSTRSPAQTATGSTTSNPPLPRTSTPIVESKRGDEMSNTQDGSSKSKQMATGTTIGNPNTLIPNKPLTSAERTRDEDEESLEYTRNPFEDED